MCLPQGMTHNSFSTFGAAAARFQASALVGQAGVATRAAGQGWHQNMGDNQADHEESQTGRPGHDRVDWNHVLDWTRLDVLSSDDDHRDVEGGEDDEAASQTGLFPVIVQGTQPKATLVYLRHGQGLFIW